MENTKKPVNLWLIAGIVLSLCTLFTVVYGLNSSPVVLVDSASVVEAAEQTLECVRSGDYDALGQMLYGAPNLGQCPEKEDTAESKIWYAYLDSIVYQISDEITPTASGVSLTAQVTTLDIPAVSASLQEIVPDLLPKMAKDSKEKVYDAEHKYTDAFVAEVLNTAADQVLSGRIPAAQREITLELVRFGGSWQVVPTQQLQQFLSGSVSE